MRHPASTFRLAVAAMAVTTLGLSASAMAAGGPAGAGRAGATEIGPGATHTFVTPAGTVTDPLAFPAGPGEVAPRPTGGKGTGEGELWLTLSAPGTSWASSTETAVVVDVSVDGGTPQQIVLFDGGDSFTYTGFTGPLATGAHRVSVRVDPTLSHTATPASVDVSALHLEVVPTSSPDYALQAYAPVLYGRHSAASNYTPLLVDGSDTVDPATGDQRLAYTYVISAHDQGDSLVPAYQWALWGRMTDIVSIVNETVAPSGAVLAADYASCGCENIPDFPDSVMAPQETTAPIPPADYDGHHPVLRDATATNYASDQGTTPFRFQQAPMAAPPPGQLRSEIMDEHPWTYRISNEELPREHVISTNPDDLLVGDYRQYAVIDSDIVEHGAQDVQFEIQLAGDPTWYSTDYRQASGGVASTFPFNDGGHHRTVIKLPTDWAAQQITGLRVRLDAPAGTTATGSITSLRLLEVTPDWQVVSRAYPEPVPIYSALSLIPVGVPG